MYEKIGTHLPNVREIVFSNGNTLKTKGAYVWPSGWVTIYPGDTFDEGRIFSPGMIREITFGGEDEPAARGPWDLNDDEINGVTIAVNTILQGSWTGEGVEKWWSRSRHELGGKSPNEKVAEDPTTVVQLALGSLGMTAS